MAGVDPVVVQWFIHVTAESGKRKQLLEKNVNQPVKLKTHPYPTQTLL